MKCLEQITLSKHWTGLSLFSITIKIIKVYNKSVILLPVTTPHSLLFTKFTREFARKMSVLTSLIRCDNTDLLPGWAARLLKLIIIIWLVFVVHITLLMDVTSQFNY